MVLIYSSLALNKAIMFSTYASIILVLHLSPTNCQLVWDIYPFLIHCCLLSGCLLLSFVQIKLSPLCRTLLVIRNLYFPYQSIFKIINLVFFCKDIKKMLNFQIYNAYFSLKRWTNYRVNCFQAILEHFCNSWYIPHICQPPSNVCWWPLGVSFWCFPFSW